MHDKWNEISNWKFLCSHIACTTQLNHWNVLQKDFFLHCLQFATMCIGYDFKVCLNTKHCENLFCNFAKLSLSLFSLQSPSHSSTLSVPFSSSFHFVTIFLLWLSPCFNSSISCTLLILSGPTHSIESKTEGKVDVSLRWFYCFIFVCEQNNTEFILCFNIRAAKID